MWVRSQPEPPGARPCGALRPLLEGLTLYKVSEYLTHFGVNVTVGVAAFMEPEPELLYCCYHIPAFIVLVPFQGHLRVNVFYYRNMNFKASTKAALMRFYSLNECLNTFACRCTKTVKSCCNVALNKHLMKPLSDGSSVNTLCMLTPPIHPTLLLDAACPGPPWLLPPYLVCSPFLPFQIKHCCIY